MKKIIVDGIRAGVPTENGRIYSEELLQRAIDVYRKNIENGSSLGEYFHEHYDGDDAFNPKDASHRITDLKLDDDGRIVCEIETLDTLNGKKLREIIDAKKRLGVDMRSVGVIVDNVVASCKIISVDFYRLF